MTNKDREFLEIFVTTWNNQDIIQDFIDWYRNRIKDCIITVYDNESSDNTVEICKNNGCNIISFSTEGKMDESKLMSIRNNCWKDSKAQVICIVDSDELVELSEDLFDTLEDWNIIKCHGIEMFGDEGDKLEDLVYGVDSVGYNKASVFYKDSIREIHYGAGSHSETPIPNDGFKVIYCPHKVNLYHTKWRSWSNGIGKAHEIALRRSDSDKARGWNFHYSLADSIHADYYGNGYKNRVKVR